MHRSQPRGILHWDARGRAILCAVKGCGSGPHDLPVDVQYFDPCGEAVLASSAVIDDLDAIGLAVPLDVQWLGTLLTAEIGGRGFEIIVVGLPHKGRPAWVAHPQQQSHAVFTLRLEHCAVALIVHELSEGHPFFDCIGAAVAFVHDGDESGGALRTLKAEIMQAPIESPWPQRPLWRHGTAAYERRDVAHAHLTVQVGVCNAEVFPRWERPVRPMSADNLISGTGDLEQARMVLRKDGTNAVLKWRGRKAFVTSAVEADGGVVADSQNEVSGVAQKQGVVCGNRAIPRVRQPEVLPDDDAVPVAGFVEGVVSDLPDPIADHGEVHLAVVAHCGVILARSIAQHRLGEAPVPAARDETPAVNPHLQRTVFLAVGKLADTHFECLAVERFLI